MLVQELNESQPAVVFFPSIVFYHGNFLKLHHAFFNAMFYDGKWPERHAFDENGKRQIRSITLKLGCQYINNLKRSSTGSDIGNPAVTRISSFVRETVRRLQRHPVLELRILVDGLHGHTPRTLRDEVDSVLQTNSESISYEVTLVASPRRGERESLACFRKTFGQSYLS